MSDYIEFKGRNLDEAIREACSFYGVEREKLEIDIITDAKSGIFGLVGAKKAAIRARRAHIETKIHGLQKPEHAEPSPRSGLKSAPSNLAGPGRGTSQRAEAVAHEASPKDENVKEGQRQQPRDESRNKSRRDKAEPGQAGQSAQPRPQEKRRPEQKSEPRPEQRSDKKQDHPERKDKNRPQPGNRQSGERSGDRPQPQKGKVHRDNAATALAEGVNSVDDVADELALHGSRLPEVPLDNLDHDLLCSSALETVRNLASAIVGPDAEYRAELSRGRLFVIVDKAENPGLLIGRDGQTLSSMQYLASCIVSRRMQVSLRVQIDAGDYRERQSEKLHEMAVELAQKVKELGKPQSTRPLSAYHRRMVHMALQDDEEVQTHSKGEGAMKRIVIVPRRKSNREAKNDEPQAVPLAADSLSGAEPSVQLASAPENAPD